MKNILKYITLIAVGCLITVSCDYDNTNFKDLSGPPDANATYYVQFKDAAGDAGKILPIVLTPMGLQEISVDITAEILGLPLDQDITVNISVDASSTAMSNMYQLGSTSIVIPAGQTASGTTLTSILDNLVTDETVSIVLNLDAGENTASAGAQITYWFLKPEICLPVAGDFRVDMHDSWGDGWQTSSGSGGPGIQVTVDGVVIEVGLDSGYEGTAIVTIPDPSFSINWYFPGDWYGEISFEIYDPSDNLVYSQPQGTGVAGDLDFDWCQ